MNKILLIALLSAGAYTPADAVEISSEIAYGSDYIWRGESQNAGNWALSGGVELNYENGIQLGMWASEVDYGNDANFEYDLYGGYGWNITDEISMHAGYIQYSFDGDTVDTLKEWTVGASYRDFSAAYFQDIDNADNNFAKYNYKLPIEMIDISLWYIDPKDMYGANLSTEINDVNISWILGSDEAGETLSEVNFTYNF
jgi:uncharacterized protein (TIGR02001 family)